MRILSQTRLIGLFCCCGLILIILTSRPLDPQCVGSPLELGEEARSLGYNQGICWCLLDDALLRLTSSHLVEPARKTQDTLEVLCVSQLAWEHPRKSWLGRIYFGYPMYKVWVGLELQLTASKPSSNFCWLKPHSTKILLIFTVHHHETLSKPIIDDFFGIKRQTHRKSSLTVHRDGCSQSLSLPDVKRLETFCTECIKILDLVCTRHSTSVPSHTLLLFVISL